MSPEMVNPWKCQRCGHDEADHVELAGTIPLAKLKEAVAEDMGGCNVEGCECKQFQMPLPDRSSP